MISVAIDGPSGSGKSSISKILAQKLGFLTLDTGALYRTLSYYFLKNSVNFESKSEILNNLKNINISVSHSESGEQTTYLNGENVNDRIRTPEISAVASVISAIPEVRNFLLDFQRNFAKNHNVVMDGRDIGTVILPNASVKIFLTASPEARAERRYTQLMEKEPTKKRNKEDILNFINARDCNDSTRKLAPLTPAKDAVIIDNSSINLEETVELVLKIIKERAGIETK